MYDSELLSVASHLTVYEKLMEAVRVFSEKVKVKGLRGALYSSGPLLD